MTGLTDMCKDKQVKHILFCDLKITNCFRGNKNGTYFALLLAQHKIVDMTSYETSRGQKAI